MSNGDERDVMLPPQDVDTLPPPPAPATDPADDIDDDTHAYFAVHFGKLYERLDNQDRVLAEMAGIARTNSDNQKRLLDLVNDSLGLSKHALEVQEEIASLDFRVRLIELKLKMKTGELPK